MTKTKVVWREWYNEAAVDRLAQMKTLPRYEIELDTECEVGAGVARMIAEDASEHGSECFRESGDMLVILSPPEFVGTYLIDVEYEPTFYANKSMEEHYVHRSEMGEEPEKQEVG